MSFFLECFTIRLLPHKGDCLIKYINERTKIKLSRGLSRRKAKELHESITEYNACYFSSEIAKTDYLLSNINGHSLDIYQRQAILMDEDYLLINAGAGSGKTLTMIGKIRYLIAYLNYQETDILCISFTNNTTNNLKEKLQKYYNYHLEVYTFHKLALEIIKCYDSNYTIAHPNTLEYLIKEFFATHSQYCAKFLKKYSYLELQNLIITFINLFKANCFKYSDFNTFFQSNFSYQQHQLLKLIFLIYNLYEQELKSKKELDFNDMINLATQLIQKEYCYKKFKYIIIDEYQDTSLTRFKLIQSIIKQTNAKLLVVGDDFQSIYRFTGCDLSLFLNFKKYFPYACTTNIINTYRNPQELINVAGDFVMQNPHQIPKELKSLTSLPKPLKIIFTNNEAQTLIKYLEELSVNELFVIGRNNQDIQILPKEYQILPDGSILKDGKFLARYLTAHKAKGLESRVVILINLTDRPTGFPSQLTNPQLLKYVTLTKEQFPFDEERRLFYVALTRTQTANYLIVSRKNPSLFVRELLKKYPSYIEVIYD